MERFTELVAEKWKISGDLARLLCASFEAGYLPYYLADYHPTVAAESDINQLWEIYDFLNSIAALAPKKKRLINAMKKAGTLNDTVAARIEFTTDGCELDDMMIALRPNPRSKAQQALKKGLGSLADIVIQQEEEETSLEDLAKQYVGKDNSLKSVDDVLSGVRDIVAERFAYDEEVRAMAREFCYEDGFFDVQPKNKKDTEFGPYRNKLVPVHELSQEEVLKLLWAEDTKRVRLKLGVQLFRITEVLRQHFIENPDAVGFDLICEAIDDCWQRLLLPIVERDVKARLRQECETWALGMIGKALDEKPTQNRASEVVISVGLDKSQRVVCVALTGEGRLLGASGERKPLVEPSSSERLSKLLERYRPSKVVIPVGERGDILQQVVELTLGTQSRETELVQYAGPESGESAANSEWMKSQFADLGGAMQDAFARGLSYVLPMALVPQVGVQYFDLHPLQKYVSPDKLNEMIQRKVAGDLLHQGVPVREAPSSVLAQLPGISENLLTEIRNADVRGAISTKRDLRSAKGVNDVVDANIAGYIVLPGSANALDRTLVHPLYYDRIEQACRDMGVSADALVEDPELLRSLVVEELNEKLFIERNLIAQLRVGARHASSAVAQPRRKLRLSELQEGMVVQGTVTNITQFGVFVNINAVCDGLVHISQLADSYVESPEQVVSVGERVHVRIIKVDVKKRRISLSMKNLGTNAPKVKASKSQLSSLIDHFSNR